MLILSILTIWLFVVIADDPDQPYVGIAVCAHRVVHSVGGVAVDENACTFVIQDERNRNYALLSDRALTMTQVDDSIINIWTQDKVE